MLQPFEAGKTAKELGINTTRRFVLTKDIEKYHKGLMFTVKDADPEKGYATFFCLSRDPFETFLIDWKNLAYAPQSDVSPEKHALREEAPLSSPTEEYKPQEGDIVSVQFDVEQNPNLFNYVDLVLDDGLGRTYAFALPKEVLAKKATLISRKAKRKVTMEEIRKLLGEDVEIVDPLPTQQEEKAIYEKMYHVCSTACSIPCPNKV